uniref:Kinetoplast ribosomal PPR-repeat containing protein 3 n=1 Tax=Trypanosoma vivax (strain Y486) TaxID=1055687 RepID=G0TZY8_TRYVY|nr:conserved hypothetical protein [Trypanosoma vivax Y486]
MLLRRLHVLSILSPLADSPDLQKASAVVSFRTNCSNSLVDDAARFRQCDAARHRRQRMGGAVYTSEDTYRSSTDSVLQVEQSSTKRLPSKFRRCRVVQRNRVCGRHAGQEKEGSEERIDRDATTAHDPATVVTLDSREQQLHLNFIQHELVWSARSREYQQLLVRVVTCLESHLAPIEKCHTLLVLHEEVVQKRIRLRSDTYEDIFHTFHAVAMLGSAVPAIEAEEVNGRGAFGITSTSFLPPEFIGANVAAASLVSAPALQNLWTIYRYMIDSGTNPTARITQYVMAILERYPRKDPIVEARAHSLMMDIDRFRLTPTEYTVNSYIGVCDRNGVMHLAVARVTDYRTRHGRQPSAGMYARLLFGLVHNQQHKEALTCLATMSSVPITQHLLNATLLVARHSRDPLSAFSVYKSVMSRQSRTPGSFHMVPGAHTFSILLEAMWEAQCFGELDFLLREMQRYSVKGSQRTLNKLLRTLLELGRREEATTLCAAMGKKGMTVFDELKRECSKRDSSV